LTTFVRVLLLADTHLGFDLPFRPRVQRRRRGYDFFANTELALQPALRGEVDLVVHGGDLLYRSRVPPALVEMALAPLVRVAARGTPVFLVPGNHERSRIPLHLWARHQNLHIFEQPRTFLCSVPGGSVALSGFPFVRDVAARFLPLVQETGFGAVSADVHLLCMHQTVEGARVGPSDYTFRSGSDIVVGSEIPQGLDAVLVGHIHRAQVLERDLAGRPLAAPVIYPGSVERTAFAERSEVKGYAMVTIAPPAAEGSRPVKAEFVPLPARPMEVLICVPDSADPNLLFGRLEKQLSALPPDAVVRLELQGAHAAAARAALSAAPLRHLAPSSMNVELAPERARRA
jgi:DNA repair exonuclease SbcCD nuclease subunit